jgi:predicted short-subunit dehydrogenase-like oxidoreductase (DUF2520 family)
MVVAVSTATLEKDDALEVLLPQAKRLSDIQILEAADLVLLAVPAAEITAVISNLSDSWRAGQLVVHLAAEFDHEILSEALSKGAIPLAIHPAMRFTGTSLDLNRMKESFFAVSAPAVALPIAQALVIEMGAEPIVITSSARGSGFVQRAPSDQAGRFDRGRLDEGREDGSGCCAVGLANQNLRQKSSIRSNHGSNPRRAPIPN